MKDKVWFFAGYAQQTTRPSARSLGEPGHFPATQTFDNGAPNNKTGNYNVTSQLANSLRVRFTGNNETQKGSLGLPAIEPNGTSTASAATFNPRSPVFTDQYSNAYSGIVDWVATRRPTSTSRRASSATA
jgi:hypothetical protein